MNLFTKRSLQALVAGSALIGSFALAGTALAAGPQEFGRGGAHMARPAAIGTVASTPDASGTFTITSKNWQRGTTATTPITSTYSVTTTGATTVTKGGTASTVSAITIGDTVMVQGTLTGTTVTATSIRDGVTGRPGMMGGKLDTDTRVASRTPSMMGSQLPAGNGQPVIGGNVTAVSGKTITVTNKGNVTYTIDATSAVVTKEGVTAATITNVVVGDSIVAQGAINGTSMTATSVLDQGMVQTATSVTASPAPAHRGILGSIGGFFSHLFGF